MYVPDWYRPRTDAAVARLIGAYPFAVLALCGPEGPMATQVPLLPDPARPPEAQPALLLGHLARRNRQADLILDGTPVLAVFTGPSAYVSPRWYRDRLDVPTWNYVSVQARGALRRLDDQAHARRVLEASVDAFEAAFDPPWRLAEAPADYVARLLPGIVAFSIEVASWSVAEKLSQTKTDGDHARVAEGLAASGEEMAAAVARLMRAQRGVTTPPG
jgi:transcriptional regulator